MRAAGDTIPPAMRLKHVINAACWRAPMNPKTDGHDPDTWCYAVKEHIEFTSANRLLVTYACNSFKLDKLVSNMSIYRPQAVFIEFPVKNN